MLTWLNHVAIAVPDLEMAAAQYRSLGVRVSDRMDLQEHGVSVVLVSLANTNIELLHPLGENSPIVGLLEKNPTEGVHHLCFEVDHIDYRRNNFFLKPFLQVSLRIDKTKRECRAIWFCRLNK